MPLTGAFNNHADSLSRLGDLKRRLLKQAANHPRPATKAKPRHGFTQEAVIKVLAANSPEPILAKEIAAAAERLPSMPVSRDTVYSCLSVGIKDPDRVSYE